MQYPWKYQAKKVMKFRVLKVESANSMMSGSKSFCGTFMIPVTMLIMKCDVCRKAGPHIAGKTKFATVKNSLNVKVLCLKHEKCFNMVSTKAHSSTKHVLSHSGD